MSSGFLGFSTRILRSIPGHPTTQLTRPHFARSAPTQTTQPIQATLASQANQASQATSLPGHPGQPGQPGLPGQLSHRLPSQPGQPSQPSQAGQPGQPTRQARAGPHKRATRQSKLKTKIKQKNDTGACDKISRFNFVVLSTLPPQTPPNSMLRIGGRVRLVT